MRDSHPNFSLYYLRAFAFWILYITLGLPPALCLIELIICKVVENWSGMAESNSHSLGVGQNYYRYKLIPVFADSMFSYIYR